MGDDFSCGNGWLALVARLSRWRETLHISALWVPVFDVSVLVSGQSLGDMVDDLTKHEARGSQGLCLLGRTHCLLAHELTVFHQRRGDNLSDRLHIGNKGKERSCLVSHKHRDFRLLASSFFAFVSIPLPCASPWLSLWHFPSDRFLFHGSPGLVFWD